MINGWQKETIRGGQGPTTNSIIRYNKLVDTCKGIPGDPTASARCTAPIAMWSNTVNGIKIYGNLIFSSANYPGDPAGGVGNSNGCIFLGESNPPPAANNSEIYNNTIVCQHGISCVVGFPCGGSGNKAFNNAWYNVNAQSVGRAGAVPSVCSNNSVMSSGSQFVNPVIAYPAAGFDYHLAAATAAGIALTAPYNQDMDGLTRGVDGTWDLGAYEFGGSVPIAVAPMAPRGLRFQ